MIICPNCQHQEISGALFCSDCGAQLVDESETNTKAFTTERIHDVPVVRQVVSQAEEAANWLTIQILENGQLLPLPDRTEITLGRIVQDQPFMPDIDFSPYNAYENGVSRLHAVLKRDQRKITIMDLGSSNGTYLNGKKIKANIASPLRNGDLVSLGKLKLQILFKI
ncbi:MAG: FHA domain-containing protein [Anaerolineales bacterium]|nr:FHA domain-containing protein [Anaerolineales bacterium]